MKALLSVLIFSLVLFSFQIDASSLSGKKILFDAIHDQGAGNSDWFIDLSYSSFADALKNAGAEINSIEGDWTKDVVLDFDVLIIPEPQTPFTNNEKDIVKEMLKAGKGVFILGNGSNIDSNNDGYNCTAIINDLLNEYGIKANNDSLRGNPLKIKTYENSSFINSKEEISCWDGMTFNSSNLKPAVEVGNNIFIGYSEINSGRLVVCGDTDMFGDGTGSSGDKLYDDYKLGTHKKISVNIIRYLTFDLNPVVDNNNDNNDNGNTGNTGNSDNPYEEQYSQMKNLQDDDLISELHDLIDNQKSYGYSEIRKIMFSDVDNENGYVQCVYTNLKVKTNSTPNGTIMNCEHTWPQSKFSSSESGIKKTDLFHLYPSDSKANSRRSSHPFGNVVNVKWSKDGSKLGTNDKGRTVYEPPDRHKGNVARSLFYFSTRYGQKLDSMQEDVLRQWNKLDPVDDKERQRNNKIYGYQHNRNPYIDHPEFIDRISDL